MSNSKVNAVESTERERGPIDSIVFATRAAAGFSLLHRQGVWRDALLRRMLALGDAAAVLLAAVGLGFFDGGLEAAFWASLFVPAWLVLAKLNGLYDRDQRSLRHLTTDELPAIYVWAMAGTALLTGVLLVVMPHEKVSATSALRIWAIAGSAAVVFRGLARIAWRRLVPRERTVIVGQGPLADATRRKLELFPDIHASVVAPDRPHMIEDVLASPERLGDIDRIILASHAIDETQIAELVGWCRREHVKLSVIPPARGMFGTAVQLNHIADLPVVEYNTWDVSRSTLLLKRLLDIVGSAVALVVLSPVLLLASAAILVESGWPVLFVQVRAGRDGRTFRMVKFRTMVHDAEGLLDGLVAIDRLQDPMFKLARDPRVTRLGRLLRRTSIDELPQLVNVLRGEMSLVGPRPEQVELVRRYRPEHLFRLMVKPGLTGPMQVFGRGRLRFEERLAVEREYIENLSLSRDLRILALTIPSVFDGRGAY